MGQEHNLPELTERQRDAQDALRVAFAPRSAAIAGVSASNAGWGGGQSFLRGIRNLDRLERVYCLNPKGGELSDGTPLYRSLADIPDDVDYVISAVPASAILGLIDDCVAKGVRAIHLFTAGFSETGSAERADLEREALKRLRDGGIRLIGPNCMGIHSTRGGISFMESASPKAGRVGMLSQSGMNASEALNRGQPRGIRFSNVASFGNAADLNEADFLQFLADDPDTDIVLAYLEGIRDGQRFLQVAKSMAGRRPLAVLKGGLTEAGGRAANSHTGSLAGSAQIWRAVQRQAGFMPADSVDELLDIAVTIERMPDLRGPRAAVLGGGGGVSVLAADICDRAGIPVPWFSETTQEQLRRFTPVAGTSVRNPLDAGFMFEGDHLEAALTAVAQDESIDWLMVHTGTDSGFRSTDRKGFEERFAGKLGELAPKLGLPLAVVIRPPASADGFRSGLDLQQRLNEAGIACYQSLEACVTAVRRYLNWRADA